MITQGHDQAGRRGAHAEGHLWQILALGGRIDRSVVCAQIIQSVLRQPYSRWSPLQIQNGSGVSYAPKNLVTERCSPGGFARMPPPRLPSCLWWSNTGPLGLTWDYGVGMIGTRVCRAGLPAAGDGGVLARAAGPVPGTWLARALRQDPARRLRPRLGQRLIVFPLTPGVPHLTPAPSPLAAVKSPRTAGTGPASHRQATCTGGETMEAGSAPGRGRKAEERDG